MPGAGLLLVLLALPREAEPAGAGADTAVTTVPAPAAGRAVTGGLVIVLRSIAPDELTQTALARVTGELSAARFRVLLLPLEAQANPAREVETVGADQEPVAAIAIARVHAAAGDAVAIWTCDRRTRRTTILRIQMSSTPPQRQAAVLAVEAIELIRASVSGLDTALSVPARPPPGPPPAPPVVSPPRSGATTGGSRLVLGLGGAAAWDVGLGGPAWSPVLWGGLRATRNLTISGRISALGSALKVTAPAGTADVHRDVAAVVLAWTFGRRGPLEGFLSLAAAIEQLRAEGAAPSPARASTATAWPVLGIAGAGVRLHVAEQLAIVAAAEGVLASRRLTLRFDDTESNSLSRPGVLLHGGIEASF
jgi:hypothetical protein